MVLLIRVVGMVLVIALLTLPPAIAGYFSRQLWQMMLWAVLFCAILVGAGIALQLSGRFAQRPGDHSPGRERVLADDTRQPCAAKVKAIMEFAAARSNWHLSGR